MWSGTSMATAGSRAGSPKKCRGAVTATWSRRARFQFHPNGAQARGWWVVPLLPGWRRWRKPPAAPCRGRYDTTDGLLFGRRRSRRRLGKLLGPPPWRLAKMWRRRHASIVERASRNACSWRAVVRYRITAAASAATAAPACSAAYSRPRRRIAPTWPRRRAAGASRLWRRRSRRWRPAGCPSRVAPAAGRLA